SAREHNARGLSVRVRGPSAIDRVEYGMARPRSPVATLGQLHRESYWLWGSCENHQCRDCAPMALVFDLPGSEDVERHAAAIGALHEVRSQGRDAADRRLGRRADGVHVLAGRRKERGRQLARTAGVAPSASSVSLKKPNKRAQSTDGDI